jgi:broad specificity phosphatase PhoE
VLRVLDSIASRHQGGSVILASHGNLIALALHAFIPNIDYAFWESIPSPAVFSLVRDGQRWQSAPRQAQLPS